MATLPRVPVTTSYPHFATLLPHGYTLFHSFPKVGDEFGVSVSSFLAPAWEQGLQSLFGAGFNYCFTKTRACSSYLASVALVKLALWVNDCYN